MREESAPLLAQRLRSGLCFLLIALAPFTSYELGRAARELEPFAAVKVVQLGTILAAFLCLRVRIRWRGCVAVAFAVLGTVYATTAVTGVLAQQALGTITLAIGLSMGAAMLLPWGVGAQSAVVALGICAVAANVVAVEGADGLWEPALVCVVLAGLSSVCAAHEFEEHRIARRLLDASTIELRVAAQAGDGFGLPPLLERVCRLAVELVPADRAAIYLWSERYGAFVPAAEHGTPPEVAARLTGQPIRPAAVQRALRDGTTVVLSRSGPLDADAARELAGAELSALALIPLPAHGRPLGCLMVGLHEAARFDESALVVARSVATQAAAQIEKARLFDKLQKAAAFRARLATLAAGINAQGDRHAIGRELCARGAALFGVSAGTVLLRDGDMLAAVAPCPAEAEGPPLRLPLIDGPGPITRALDDGRPWFANDVRTTSLKTHPLVHALGVESLLIVPLIGQTGPLGCLVYGDARRRHAFSPAIAEEAVLLAGIAAAALERAHFAEVDEARHYAERHAAGLARYAAELAKARNAALESARVKSEFLANMSHEIRTPMTAILGYVRLLSERAISEADHDEYLATIRRNGEHLLRILNDVLDLSKLDAGRMTLERIACSPAELVNEVASLMRARAIEKGLDLVVDYRGDIPEQIQADPTRLRQILLNLVGNAVKFTEIGRVTIGVELHREPDAPPELQIDVADTGCGLSEDAVATLFDAFTQGDPSTTRTSGGTGLGLAISQRLARMLGGDITVRSEVEVGSVFTLRLETGPLDGVPMVAQPTEVCRRPAPASTVRRLPSRARVLLVEDALDNQRLLAFYLREAGAEVQVAADGVTACEMALGAAAAGTPFDVVLMDVQMPRLDGYHATARLRGAGYRGAIVALTAHAMESERGRCLDAGCDDFLSKPVEPSELVGTIAKHLATDPAAERAPVEPPLVSHLAGSEGLDDLLREFVETLPERVAAMDRDLATGDLQSLAGRIHQLKGTAGVYGFPRLTEAARELETALKGGRPIHEIRGALGRLGTLCRRVDHRRVTDTEPRLAAAS